MEEDEPRTLELIRHHNEIVFPIISGSSGEVVDAIGDGLLAMFPSVLDAVTCAVSIQREIADRNRNVDTTMSFKLRIGVHLGEIWQENKKIYGNGVNIAARVQPFAAPGGICVTDDVYRQVVNKLDVPIESIGVRELNNIARRVELFAVKTGYEMTVPESAGEFDAIKERLLKERENIASKRYESEVTSDDSQDLGKTIENRVFSFVERVMDKAIEKWDGMPEEKKAKAMKDINIKIHEHKDVKIHRREKIEKSKKGEVGGSITAGLIFGTGFGIGFFAFGISWMIWPMLIIGALPLGSGIVRAIKLFIRKKQQARERPKEIERQILKTAGRLGGRVTVVQIAAEANLTLDEASSVLDSMTKRGYVMQNILESGVIEYEFPAMIDKPRSTE